MVQPEYPASGGEAEAIQSASASLLGVAHRPYALPARRWRMRQVWNDLLFAHWPVAAASVERLIPEGLELERFDGTAWVGVVPFWMDQVEHRIMGERTSLIPTVHRFSELNLRTYVRSPRTGKRGVYFFSLDCSSALAVAGARMLFHLPYFLAAMSRGEEHGAIRYRSRRLLPRASARFSGSYRAIGPAQRSLPGSLAHFLTERYCLFTPHRGHILVGEIHHVPWPLQPAEAEIQINEIPAAHGLVLEHPEVAPVLHFSRRLEVHLWMLCVDV